MFRYLLLLLVILPIPASAQWRNQLTPAQEKIAYDLADRLFRAIDPDRPENSYFPEPLKEKIRWVYQEKAANRLDVTLVTDSKGTLGQRKMSATYVGGKPRIELPARVAFQTSLDPAIKSAAGERLLRNSFAVGIAHEATHLIGLPSRFFSAPQPRSVHIAEEMRTWTEMDELIVTPMIAAREPLHSDFVNFYNVRRTCGKNKDCPQLRAFIEASVSK